MMAKTVWIVLVFAASMAGLQSAVPPNGVCPYNVTDCKCTGTSLVCSYLNGIPPLVSDNKNSTITDLTFTNCRLKNISSNSLPANLQKLTFSQTSITSISSDAFSNSATTLKSFTMNSLNYPELPRALLNVTNLTELTLSDAFFDSWTLAIVEHVGKTLRSVVLSHVGLDSWPEWLKDFTLLNSLDFSRSPADVIPVDAFTKIKNLTTLILRATNFTNETNMNAALKPLSAILKTLDISDIGYGDIPEVVAGMSSLSKLKVSDNNISEITSDRIPPQLKELDASGNNMLGSITDNSFPNASSLEVLILSNMFDLVLISDLAFQPLGHLRELYLNYSNVRAIPFALTKLNNLQILNMDGIRLACPCSRNDTLVTWYASQKTLHATGKCWNNDYSLDYYLSNTDGKSPCSGNSLVSFTFLLYFCLVVAMSVLVM